ncbi:MAG: M13 family peptidase, partial [Bryobacteraceae bacterium]
MLKFRFILLASLYSMSLPAQQGFDLNSMDKKADPCVDFYQYACGSWLVNNAIPPDQSTWGRFSELQERNQKTLRDILETSSGKSNKSAVEQKIGDYYSSCMDEKTINARGVEPLKPELERISAIKDKQGLVDAIVRLHRLGVNAGFDFSSGQDFEDATKVIAHVDQGGLGLPDRDYYFKEDPKSAELRKKYVHHVENMFTLLGEPQSEAAAKAKTVMEFETSLAKASLDRVARRNPRNLYHPMPVKELVAMNPSFNWPRYLSAIGAPRIESLNVAVPS